MTLLLDTSILIDALRGRPDVARQLAAVAPSALSTCSVVRAELLSGAARRDDGGRAAGRVYALLAPMVSHPFDDAAADRYGLLHSLLSRAGAMIGTNDLQIASIALARGVAVVTSNTREFARIPGLDVIDWRES